jgi:hypothetical protein
MNCKKVFTQDFLFEKCTSTFLNKELKKHREVVLLNEQKSYLPATQPYVIVRKEQDRIKKEVQQLELEKNRIFNEINTRITRLMNESHALGNNVNTTIVTERKKFIRKCPMTDCRGFLSQQWKCGICDSKICNKCNEEKLDTECDAEGVHQCKPENVASMELLNKDTKPCPECGTMIFRIAGCAQMFCVDCHCAWNWNTGLVEKGVIHNPHYYEFLRKSGNGAGGRNHGDIPCGGVPHINEVRTFLHELLRKGCILQTTEAKFYRIHNVVTHIQHFEILRLNNNNQDMNEQTTRTLRIDYMMNKITEESFMKELQQIQKMKSKKRDFSNIYQMFVDVSSDIFRQLIVYYNNNKNSSDFKNNMKNYIDEQTTVLINLKDYFNENIKKCGKGYKCVYPGITEGFSFESNIVKYDESVRINEERIRQRKIMQERIAAEERQKTT